MNKLSFVLALVFFSCSVSELPEEDLKAYILNEENGLHKVVTKGDITIEASYWPTSLVWKNELKEAEDADTKNRLMEQYDSLNYFLLHFSRNGDEIENNFVSNRDYFSSVINYLSFQISRDIFQVNGRDTTMALDVIYSRTFGLTSGTAVIAVFPGDLTTSMNDVTICFNDTMLDMGASKFEFKSSDIRKTPTLIIN